MSPENARGVFLKYDRRMPEPASIPRDAAPAPRRRHYGIAEIADALDQNRQLVTAWRRRLSHAMPPPDDELASGPLWLGPTIEPWIDRMRRQLATDEPGAARLTEADVRRLTRRLLRLTALLLEEPARVALVVRAYAEFEQAATVVRAAERSALRDRLEDVAERISSAARPPWPDLDTASHRRLLATCLNAIGAVAEGTGKALRDG
jgi:hypothetical protein